MPQRYNIFMTYMATYNLNYSFSDTLPLFVLLVTDNILLVAMQLFG